MGSSFKTSCFGVGAPFNGVFLALGLVSMTLCFSGAFSELTKFQQGAKPDGSLDLLVVGDWGRKGTYNQSKVAEQMGRIGNEMGIDFVISTGDNFYDNGLTGVDDPAFEQSFTSIYTAQSLQKPWYTVLGNHDYRGDVLAQLSPVLRKLNSRWLCMRSFIVETETADFFFVDTNPFVDEYWAIPNEHSYDWRGVIPRHRYIETLLKHVDVALRESSAKWKIVVGHHPIRSVGHHGNTVELDQLLLPILEANHVDLYVNGHDHCLEHISGITSPIQFLTSGGGSKAWRGIDDSANKDGLRFYYDGQGFMSLSLTPDRCEFVFYDLNGQVLHKWEISKELHFAN
ncbi:purple acid phosphatase 4 [Amborella trichopoda]|uniref:Purple acid phosphatase n=1 Tax=Amborella trichopoda TaxID=13333 RepID=W1PLW1_AMBTC|nr:purple acid phosphatase 4 [Amborella trichopoda]ERN11017.1 hypothetical protein AMTR_s00024p00043640 [Amborella trichopoda]|eukprot:XP_006849436.1 purple acid phosphatase 4 [Amborella trichopoda]